MAFILDQEIRKVSGGKRTLEDLMRVLLNKTRNSSLSQATLLEGAGEVGDLRTSELLHHGISTRESLKPAAYLPSLGLKIDGQSYQAEFYVHLDHAAGQESLQRRQAWAGF
jgi:predicted metalloprotease with PDZ domain